MNIKDKKYILALDQGTTSSKAVIYDTNSRIVSKASIEVRQYYPKPGWVEQNADEIWQTQLQASKDAIKRAKISAKKICAIGITNQRETIVAWSRKTEKPLYNAIVWQCRRTDSVCERIRTDSKDSKVSKCCEYVKDITGLVIDPYFSATKIKWLLENVPRIQDRAKSGELAIGTIDSWLIWNLTKGKVHATDISNASRTMLFNIVKKQDELSWDSELCEMFSVPEETLPEVRESNSYFGTADGTIFGAEIPITGVAGDQQAALFGQTCFDKGDTKTTYGTGSFLLMNIGKRFRKSKNLLTTVSWKLRNTPKEYAFEGSVFTAGSAIQWLKEDLGLINNASECEKYAKKVQDTNGVYFVPAFVGLGAPYWDMYARGAILGLTRGVRKEHVIRAVLESIAYRVKDITDEMERGGCKLRDMRVDGGMTSSDFLMQFQADIIGKRVLRASSTEITAQGASYLAGLGVELWKKEELKDLHTEDRVFVPSMDRKKREHLYSGWREAVKRAGNWAEIVKGEVE